MLKKICPICKKSFIKPYYCSRKNWRLRIYCSLHCFSIHNLHSIPWNKGTKGVMKPNQTSFKKGHHNPKWGFQKGHTSWLKGKKLIEDGHLTKHHNRWYVYKPSHPFSSKKGYLTHTRFIVEECLKRYLKSEEIIHHINGIKDDDYPENLYLFPNNTNHLRFHHLKNKPKLKSNII